MWLKYLKQMAYMFIFEEIASKCGKCGIKNLPREKQHQEQHLSVCTVFDWPSQ